MKRKLLVSAHLFLAAFFAPFLILIAMTGGLYLLGEKGTLRYTPIAHLEMQTLESQQRPLPEHLTALLQQAGVDNYTVRDIKVSGDTIISYPSSRDYYQFKLNTTGVEIARVSPNFLASSLALHKGHGPALFIYFEKALAIALLLVVLSGLWLGFQSPKLRKTMFMNFAAGAIVFVLLAYVL